jgi:hypothetical protein
MTSNINNDRRQVTAWISALQTFENQILIPAINHINQLQVMFAYALDMNF